MKRIALLLVVALAGCQSVPVDTSVPPPPPPPEPVVAEPAPVVTSSPPPASEPSGGSAPMGIPGLDNIMSIPDPRDRPRATYDSAPMPTSYVNVQVSGAGWSEFYYIRQDIWLSFAGNNNDRLNALVNSGVFGPHPNPARIRVKSGYNYIFAPKCGNAYPAKLISINQSGNVNLSC